MHREIRGFTAEAKAMILAYDWPGNIRQLANTIERAVILEDDVLIHPENLALPVGGKKPAQPSAPHVPSAGEPQGNGEGSLESHELELILKALDDCLWVQKNAAKKLGISPRALNYKINKLGITHHHWRRNGARDTRDIQ
jgi:DNA-binding NtrC family response regulator